MAGRNSRLVKYGCFHIKSIKIFNKRYSKKEEKLQKFIKRINSLIQKPNANLNSKFFHTYHRYVITLRSRRERNNLKKYLKKNNIEKKVHYKKPLHMYKCFKKFSFTKQLKNSENYSNLILSLPCNHFMKYEEVQFVIKKINQFIN